MQPDLAVVSPSRNAYSETFIQAHKHISGVNVRFYYGDPLPVMLEGGGELDALLWRSALRHYWGRLWGSPYTDRREDAFARSLRSERVDCVLAEYGVTGAKVLNVCKRLRLPLVVVFFGYDASVSQILQEYRSSYAEMFRYAHAVVVMSAVMHEKLRALGCPAEKLHISPCGPHDGFFDTRPSFAGKLFVSTGRFVDKKAPYYTILAFRKVLETHPDARLVIAGEGALLNACINLVRHFGIGHAVSLPGVIALDRFSEYLSGARAYVQHSITALDGDSEGVPVAIMEASAAGLPVLATRHAGIPEVVVDGRTGLLVEEHDVEGMARHMVRVLEDRELAMRMGAEGRAFIREHFSRSKHLEAISRLVLDAVEARRR